MKKRVWNTEPSDNDLVPMEDTHDTSSPDIEDPYLAQLASIIAQSQDSRILTREDYQHLRQLKEKSKQYESGKTRKKTCKYRARIFTKPPLN